MENKPSRPASLSPFGIATINDVADAPVLNQPAPVAPSPVPKPMVYRSNAPGIVELAKVVSSRGGEGQRIVSRWNEEVNKGPAYARQMAAKLEKVASAFEFDTQLLWKTPDRLTKATPAKSVPAETAMPGAGSSEQYTSQDFLGAAWNVLPDWVTGQVRNIAAGSQTLGTLVSPGVPTTSDRQELVESVFDSPVRDLVRAGARKAQQLFGDPISRSILEADNTLSAAIKPDKPVRLNPVAALANAAADKTATVLNQYKANLRPTAGVGGFDRDANGNWRFDWDGMQQALGSATGQIGLLAASRKLGGMVRGSAIAAAKTAGDAPLVASLLAERQLAQQGLSLASTLAPELEGAYQSAFKATGDPAFSLNFASQTAPAVSILDTFYGAGGMVTKVASRELRSEAISEALKTALSATGKSGLSAEAFTQLAKVAGRTYLKLAADKTARGIAEEGGTEMLQEGITMGAETLADAKRNSDDFAANAPDPFARLVGAGVTGALFGGAMGAAAHQAGYYHPTAFKALHDAHTEQGVEGLQQTKAQLLSGLNNTPGLTPEHKADLIQNLDKMASVIASSPALSQSRLSPALAYQLYDLNYRQLPRQQQQADDLAYRIEGLGRENPVEFTLNQQGNIVIDEEGYAVTAPVDPAMAAIRQAELQKQLEITSQRLAYTDESIQAINQTGKNLPNFEKNLIAIGSILVGDVVSGKPIGRNIGFEGVVRSLSPNGLTAQVEGVNRDKKEGDPDIIIYEMAVPTAKKKLIAAPDTPKPEAGVVAAKGKKGKAAKPTADATQADQLAAISDGLVELSDNQMPQSGQQVILSNDPTQPQVLREKFTDPDDGLTYAHLGAESEPGRFVSLDGDDAVTIIGIYDPSLAERRSDERGRATQRAAEKATLAAQLPRGNVDAFERMTDASLINRFDELRDQVGPIAEAKRAYLKLLGEDRGLLLTNGPALPTEEDYTRAAETGAFSDPVLHRLAYDFIFAADEDRDLSPAQEAALKRFLQDAGPLDIRNFSSTLARFVSRLDQELVGAEMQERSLITASLTTPQSNEPQRITNPAVQPKPAGTANADGNPSPAKSGAGATETNGQFDRQPSAASPLTEQSEPTGGVGADSPAGAGVAGQAAESTQDGTPDQALNPPSLRQQVASIPGFITPSSIASLVPGTDAAILLQSMAEEGLLFPWNRAYVNADTRAKLLADQRAAKNNTIEPPVLIDPAKVSLVKKGDFAGQLRSRNGRMIARVTSADGKWFIRNEVLEYDLDTPFDTVEDAIVAATDIFNQARLRRFAEENPGYVSPELIAPAPTRTAPAAPAPRIAPTPTVAEQLAGKPGEVTFIGGGSKALYEGRIIAMDSGAVTILITTRNGKAHSDKPIVKDVTELTSKVTGQALTIEELASLELGPPAMPGVAEQVAAMADWIGDRKRGPYIWYVDVNGQPGLYKAKFSNDVPVTTEAGFVLQPVTKYDTAKGYATLGEATVILPFGTAPTRPTDFNRAKELRRLNPTKGREILAQSDADAVVSQRIGAAALTALVDKLRKAYPRVVIKTLSDSDFIERGWDGLRGVVDQGVVHLNSERVTADTPIHELGHIYQVVGEKEMPALWSRGLDLIADSPYLDAVRRNPAYADLSDMDQRREALVQAIGERGASMGSPSLVTRIRAWIDALLAQVGKRIGIEMGGEATLDRFVDARARELITANTYSSLRSDVAAETQTDLLKQAPVLPDIIDEVLLATEVAKNRKDYAAQINERSILTGSDLNNPEYTLELIDVDDETQIISESVKKVKGVGGWLATNWSARSTALTAFKVLYGNTPAFAQNENLLIAQRGQANVMAASNSAMETFMQEALKGKTNFMSMNPAKTGLVDIEGRDRKGDLRSISVPLDVKMLIAGNFRSAMNTYGHVDPKHKEKAARGEDWSMDVALSQEGSKQPIILTLDKQTVKDIEQEIYADNPETAAIMEAWDNHAQEIFPFINRVHLLLTGRPLTQADNYVPIRAYSQETNSSPKQSRRLIDEASALSEREGAPAIFNATEGLLASIASYHHDTHRYVADAVIVHQLDAILERQQSRFAGEEAGRVFKSLAKIRDGLANIGFVDRSGINVTPEGNSVASVVIRNSIGLLADESGNLNLSKHMQRAARSIFQFNFTAQFKNVTSFVSALYTPHLKNEYIVKEGLGYLSEIAQSMVLIPLGNRRGGLSAWDWASSRHFDEVEDYLIERIKLGDTNAATLLYRVTGRAVPDARLAEWGSLKDSKTMGQAVSVWLQEYGGAGMKRADTAIVYTLLRAARAQARAEGHDEFWASEKAMRVLYESTSTFDQSDRNAIQLSRNPLNLAMNLYASQSHKIYNTLVMRGLEVDFAETPQERNAALVRLRGAQAMNLVAAIAYSRLVDVAGQKFWSLLSPDEEDEEKDINWGGQVLHLLGSMLQNLLPGPVGSFAEGISNGVAGNHGQRDVAPNLLEPVNGYGSGLAGIASSWFQKEYTTDRSAERDQLRGYKEVLRNGALLTGTPQLVSRLASAGLDQLATPPKPRRSSRRGGYTGAERLYREAMNDND